MGYYFLTASKDATLYLQQPNQNTGLDEILEISKIYYGNIKDVSHALVKFDVGYISKSISDNSIGFNDATLILRETQTNEIPLEYTIYANAVSRSWEMGTGTRFDNISTQGVTWNYREGDTKVDWLDNTFATYSTASKNDGVGGTWWTQHAASQSFNYETSDINMDVKSMLKVWMSGSIPNDGFILKYANADNSNDVESNTEDYGVIKFFSKETHTIYQPKIRIGWDDQLYVTGSLIALTAEDIKIGINNLKKEYKLNSIAKIRIFGRELYPLKTFSNQFEYTTQKYLPQTTYYQIRDFASNDIIVPFSNYSKISCDADGNYIKLNLSNWEADRVYKIEFMIEQDGGSQYFDDNITFSIAKN
jgi:hypothetical protein